MSIKEIRNYVLAVLLGFAALTLLPACSSTEEAPPPEASSTSEPTDYGNPGGATEKVPCGECPEGDLMCLENCYMN